MQLRTCLAIQLFVISFFLSPCLIEAQVTDLLVAAQTSYEAQNYTEAYEAYAAYLEKDTTDLMVYERAATCAYRLGDIISARDLFIKVESKDSTNRLGLKNLAAIYEQQKNTPKAIKYYTRLTELFPNEGLNHRKLGQQYKNAGLYRLAKEHYAEAKELNPRDLLAIDGLAELYMLEKEYIKADTMLWQGLALDSMGIDMNLLIATSKFRQKLYDSTAYYMLRIRGKFDFRPHQSRMLGYAFMQIDSLDLAIRYLSAAIMDEGTKEYANYNLGVAFELKGDMVLAKHHFGKALEAGISENVDLYHRNLARLYNKEDNLKEAIPHYKDAYKYGDDPLVLFYLGRASDAYYADKNIALRYYKKFVNSNYDHEEYKQYAKDRSRLLIEQIHQTK